MIGRALLVLVGLVKGSPFRLVEEITNIRDGLRDLTERFEYFADVQEDHFLKLEKDHRELMQEQINIIEAKYEKLLAQAEQWNSWYIDQHRQAGDRANRLQEQLNKQKNEEEHRPSITRGLSLRRALSDRKTSGQVTPMILHLQDRDREPRSPPLV